MNILLIGSVGREHALAWKMKQSPSVKKLFIAPGNAGTKQIGINVDIDGNDFAGIGDFVLSEGIDLVVVGPEEPLVKGFKDFFENTPALKGIPVFGPGKLGAQLEGSKKFAKEFMVRHNIPTAAYLSVTQENFDEGLAFLKTLSPPYVLKADGLAAGKGVLIIDDYDVAANELKAMFDGRFGDAGKTVVIEEFLSGIELSVFVVTDGKSYFLLPEAKDYKRVGEGDSGPNTGGMGSISPVPFASGPFMEKVVDRVIVPTIQGLQKDNIPYTGFIFFGLIKVGDNPYVIEYNVRLGDPEAQSVLPRLENDIVEVFEAATGSGLEKIKAVYSDKTAATVILVSGGYPGDYLKGKEIKGLEKVKTSYVFHAGTTESCGVAITNGGRVLAVTSLGKNMEEALKGSYFNAEQIHFENKYYRKDIGFDL